MTTFTRTYDAATLYPNMAAEDHGAKLEIKISYKEIEDGHIALSNAVATMYFPSGEVDDYTYEMNKDFDFYGMAIEHATE